MTIHPALAALDRLRFASDLAFTGDGRALTATIRNATSAAGSPNPSRIWRFDEAGAIPLTDGPHGDAQGRPSPCDERLAFLSDRAWRGKQALYLRAPDGGVTALGWVAGTIEDFRWLPDASAIVVLTAERGMSGGALHGATRLWWGAPEEPELTDAALRRRLYRIRLPDGHTEEVGPALHSVWEFDLLPDGAVLIGSTDASERGWHHAQLLRVRFDDRSVELLHASPWQMQGLAVDPAGDKVAFLEGWSSDRGLVAGEMWVFDLTKRALSRLAPGEQSNVTYLRWRDAQTLWFAGWQGLGSVVGLVGLDGAIESQRHEDACLGENTFLARIAVAPDGIALAAVRETIGQAPEIVWKRRLEDPWSVVSALNVGAAAAFPAYPEVRHVAWRGSDGLALESFVLLPRGHGGGPLPMVVDIHGGPCYAAKHSYNPGGALAYAAAGFAVFLPNYRGSVGWGQAFTRMNLGDPAGAEFDDILQGIEHCVALGLADPARLGVTGSSYGGFLCNWAVATTDRFKAAVSVSSIADQVSCHYDCEHDFHAFINGGPLTDAAKLRIANDRSPLLRLERPSTPTLLIHGLEDRCTPPGQARQFYGALVERGVCAQLALYPREGHGGFRETAHRIDNWQRRIAWFQRHLSGGAEHAC